MKIRKNDKVRILAGKDKGKEGKVLQVLRSEKKISVEGLNLLTKHARPRRQGDKGQKIQFPALLPMARAMLICPRCNRPTRVGFKLINEKKEKVRICRKCKEIID